MSGSDSKSPSKNFAAGLVEPVKTPQSSDKKVKENSSPLQGQQSQPIINLVEAGFGCQKQ